MNISDESRRYHRSGDGSQQGKFASSCRHRNHRQTKQDGEAVETALRLQEKSLFP